MEVVRKLRFYMSVPQNDYLFEDRDRVFQIVIVNT